MPLNFVAAGREPSGVAAETAERANKGLSIFAMGLRRLTDG